MNKQQRDKIRELFKGDIAQFEKEYLKIKEKFNKRVDRERALDKYLDSLWADWKYDLMMGLRKGEDDMVSLNSRKEGKDK